MVRKLEVDELRATIGATRDLLGEAQAAEDLIAVHQLGKKISSLEVSLKALEGTPQHSAKAALFFGGRPVSGSHGVDATFASKAIESFQRLISRQFAVLETGELSPKGRLPVQDEARMMVTEMARGSVGFVLEEAPEQGRLVATELGTAVEQVAEVVGLVAGESHQWAAAMEIMDQRVLSEVKAFFAVLDEAGASIRIVEGDNDRELSREAVHRARSRVDKARVVEEELPPQAGQIVGFTSKTFEFVREDGEKISGRIDSVPARQLEQAGVNQQIQQFMYTPLRVRLRVRTVESGGWSRRYYTLLALDDRKA